MRRRSEFVGNRCLNSAIRFFQMSFRKPSIYKQVCQPVLMPVLFELSLPLLILTPDEIETWKVDPVEYVRMQVDVTDTKNVKHRVRDLVQAICSIRQTRVNKVGNYLTNFLTLIVQTLDSTTDERQKEALLHAFSLLAEHLSATDEY